jgi:hypothetical protein
MDIEEGMWPSTPAQPSARLCNFETGKTVPLSSHKTWLRNNIVPILQRNSQGVVEVIGWASQLGSHKVNNRLAQARADAVKAFIEGEVQKSLVNVLTASQGEWVSGGGPKDNDGYYRAVQVHFRGGHVPSASPPPPPPRRTIPIGPPPATIGVPEGTLCRVVASREILKATVQCGFNDFSLPNGGIFLEETLECRTYDQGKVVKIEIKKRERFLRCAPN